MSTLGDLLKLAAASIGPYQAYTNYSEPQSETWQCYGCDGTFTSYWPNWDEPTDESFPHDANCRYIEARNKILK